MQTLSLTVTWLQSTGWMLPPGRRGRNGQLKKKQEWRKMPFVGQLICQFSSGGGPTASWRMYCESIFALLSPSMKSILSEIIMVLTFRLTKQVLYHFKRVSGDNCSRIGLMERASSVWQITFSFKKQKPASLSTHFLEISFVSHCNTKIVYVVLMSLFQYRDTDSNGSFFGIFKILVILNVLVLNTHIT